MSNQGERTEKATKKKKDDARKKGQVVKSADISTAFSIIILFGFLYAVWDPFVARGSHLFVKYLSANLLLGASETVTAAGVMHTYKSASVDFLLIMLPVLLVAMLTGLLLNILQTGFVFSTKPLAPNFGKINPLEGFKRIFSSRSLAEMFKALLKVTCLCYFVYGAYQDLVVEFPQMMALSVSTAFFRVMKACFIIGMKMGGVLAVIAVLDYIYQWWRHDKDLMMTKQEVKDEYKQMEGDPKIKGQIRQKQRQMSRMRMMQSIAQADVVITNPTHYAVALRYKEKEDKAPVVLAKGKDHIAKKIKEKAREHGVEIVENKPVAQALYAYCEVGDQIPQDLFKAVAEILVYVYKMKNKAKGEGK